MRRLRPVLFAIACAVIAIVVIFAIPTSRFLLLGAIRQENFHGDRPVSHWEYLLDDEDEQVRREAAFSLGQMGEDSRRAVPAIARLLRDPSEDVRINASLALSKIGPSASPAVEALAEGLADSHAQVRINSAMALIQFRGNALPALPALIKAIDDDRNFEIVMGFGHSIRQRCIIAVGRIGPEAREAIPSLTAALKDPHYGTRAEAAKALGLIGGDARAAVPHVRKLLKDPNEQVRANAAEALTALGAKPDADTE